MTILKICEIIGASIGTLGLLIGGIGFFISQFSSGENSRLNNNNTLLDYLRNENASYKGIVNDQTKQIAQLQADNSTLTKRVEELDAMVKGKSPDDITFRKSMLQFISDQSKYQEQNAQIMTSMVEEMKKLTGSHDQLKKAVEHLKKCISKVAHH